MSQMNMPDILRKIVEHKRTEVVPVIGALDEWRAKARDAAPALDFAAALSGPETAVIAEVKKASPSAGIIADDFDPRAIAAAYVDGGADAISVLTDEAYFKGSTEQLREVRAVAPDTPVLRKDFIICEAQIHQARALGADSFLLIAAILEEGELGEFIALGRDLGMEPLVETHDEAELEKALRKAPRIVGVNNRDLRTFEVSLDTAVALRPLIADSMIAVAESGVKSGADAARLRRAGYDALLVGQNLMEAGLFGCATAINSMKTTIGVD